MSDKNSLISNLNAIEGVEVQIEQDLKKYSTLQLKAQGDLVVITNKDSISDVLKCLKGFPYRVLGWGANQILPQSYKGFYLKLALPFDKKYFEKTYDVYTLPASVSLATLTSHASKFCLKGWEVFTGIPASLGGAIFMNAGTNLGEIGSLVKCVRYFSKDGEEKEHLVNETSFSYRKSNFLELGDIVYEVELKNLGEDSSIKETIRDYLLKRNKTQPMKEKTCGCVFKNHSDEYSTCRAGEYIDIMGLKGLSYESLMISPVHANFMINKGNGTMEEMKTLIQIVQDELYLQFGIRFDTEVKF